MKPTKKQKKWLKDHLSRWEVIDLIPRAYCVAKSTVGSATFITPQEDYREHSVTDGQRVCNSNVVIDSSSSQYIKKTCVGDWVTLVYAESLTTGTLMWRQLGQLIPLKITKEDLRRLL